MSAVACISANRLGAIPVGWLVKPIGELAVIATGNTPPTADASNYGDDFLFASPADIDDSKWIHQTGKRLSKKGFSVARPFPAKSVLFVCIGSTIGKCAIASVELTSNQQINAVFPSEHLDSEFLYYSLLMAAPSVKEQAGEQAVPLVNKTQFSGTLIAVPKVSEQRAIATALSDVDALIAGLEKLIAKKRDLKQAAMQQLLTGQTRLPGFSGEWEIKTLTEISDVIDPHPSHRAPDTVANGVPFVGIGDLDENGNIVGKKLRLVDPAVLAEHATRYDLKEDLIGLGRVASIGKVVSLKNGPSEYAISPTLGIIRGRDVQREFLIQSLKTEFITEQFLKIMSGSTRSSVGMEVLRLLKIFVPPSIEEQKAIAFALADMDAELRALESRLAKTRDLKQGMMQELLAGRTRLV